MVDDVFVTGFPQDHPEFAGNSRFSRDEENISQELWFFPEGVAPAEANISRAEKIGSTITIPARNGFHPSVGDTSFLVKTDADNRAIPGTYVFVTSFAGDDRVEPFRPPYDDVTEQFIVTSEPSIQTTLIDEEHGIDRSRPVQASGVHTLVDSVCFTNLEAHESYEIRGVLMDKSTGKQLQDVDGEPVTSTYIFIPDEPHGCVDVTFTVDGSLIAGKTTVAFETLYLDGEEIARHADIDAENQTLVFADNESDSHAEKHEDMPSRLARTGSGLIGAVLLAVILAGSGYALVRRNK